MEQNFAIAVCDYEPVAGDDITLNNDVPRNPRIKTAALFLFIGLDRVTRHIREEERSFQDLLKSDAEEFRFRKIGLSEYQYPNAFERIIEGGREGALYRILEKLKDRDVFLDVSLDDVLIWNEALGEKLTVYPLEVLNPNRLKWASAAEGWNFGADLFFYRVHRSVPPDIATKILKKIEVALDPDYQEVV